MEVLNEFCYDLRENGRQKHRPLPTWSEIKPGHGEIFVGQQLRTILDPTNITIQSIRSFFYMSFSLYPFGKKICWIFGPNDDTKKSF